MPASPTLTKQFQVGDKIRVNLDRGKIEDAVVRAVLKAGNEFTSGLCTSYSWWSPAGAPFI